MHILGRTDSNGGHYSADGYHYHHGYSAHQHPNGICGYETDYQSLLPSECTNCGSSVNSENGNYCFECGYKMLDNPINIGGVNIRYLVDGDEKKTRSEYAKEIEKLENKITTLNNTINEYQNDLKENNVNSINDLAKEKKALETKISNMWFWIFIGGIILSIIMFSLGDKSKNK